jgi:hypothetical protein
MQNKSWDTDEEIQKEINKSILVKAIPEQACQVEPEETVIHIQDAPVKNVFIN